MPIDTKKNSEKNDPIDYVILPQTHSPMYLMHKYWARKPANIVASYIEMYTKPHEIVLDPFMGSGVTILESVFKERFAVGIDINPMAKFICENTGGYVDLDLFQETFEYLQRKIEHESPLYSKLFHINCPVCNQRALISHLIWNNSIITKKEDEIVEIRLKCLKCGDLLFDPQNNSMEFAVLLNLLLKSEHDAIQYLEEHNLPIPSFSFRYNDSKQNFLQLRHNLRHEPSLQNLFSNRNFAFLVYLKDLISNLPPKFESMRKLCEFCFSSALGQASKMVWVINNRKGDKLKKAQVGSWTHHFFWDPSEYFDVNAWNCFKERYTKIFRGKKFSNIRNNQIPFKFNLSNDFKLLSPKSPALIMNESCQMIRLPDNSVDFIFTDPPYGDSIQYGELSSLWSAWLGLDMQNYLKEIEMNEITINSKQEKNIEYYQHAMEKVFSELFRVLKPGKYMLVTFHNTSFKVRNVLIVSALTAKFKLKQILFQLPPRVSLKSLLHHSGTPIGDYYIRFQKPTIEPSPNNAAHVNNSSNQIIKDHLSESEIVQKIADIIKDILHKRGEPTSFLWISNFIDEDLCKQSLFPIENFIDIIMQVKANPIFLIDKDDRWWFSEISNQEKIEISLSYKIETYLQSIISSETLSKKSKMTKQFLFNEVYKEFRGKYTPDKFFVNKIIDRMVSMK